MKKWLLIIITFLLIQTVLASDVIQNVTVTILPNKSIIVINEFAADPQTDWNNDNNTNSNDEWVELFNKDSIPVNLSNWELTDAAGVTESLDGILNPGEFVVFLDPKPTLNNNGDELTIFDQFGREIDKVAYGNFDDGNVFDNAPVGSSNDILDECIARFPNGIDTNNDKSDFIKTQCTFNATNIGNITLIPISITNLQPSPLCTLETDNLTISANITGSVKNVSLSLNSNNTQENFSLPLNGDQFFHTITSENLTGNTSITWQFIVVDILNNIFTEPLTAHHINSRTSLSVNPPNPDGLNNWYVTEPEFTLTNIDSNQLFYRWDSIETVNYSGPFGLENAPNNGNKTGGIQELNFWADICNEPEQTQFLKFDLKNPEITNLQPPNKSIIFNNPRPEIQALLDEVYQSNSGIDKSSVIMILNNNQVQINVSDINTLDAIVKHSPQSDLPEGTNIVEVQVKDNAGRFSKLIWQFDINLSTEFELTIHEPKNQNYNSRRIPFNITTSNDVEKIELMNLNANNPRFRTLCRNCNKYGFSRKRFKTLLEGENNIIIRASNRFDVTKEKNITLFIDSKTPIIKKTSPIRGFSKGFFEVEFQEDNPVHLLLNYGNTSRTKNQPVDLNSCDKNRVTKCNITVNLSEFNNQKITYNFSLIDILNNSDTSRERNLDVDLSPPLVNKFSHSFDKRRISFTFNITEPNFDKIVFIDFAKTKPKERRLCTRLDDGICKKKKSFRRGNHNLTIIAYDKAGNNAIVRKDMVFRLF